MNRRFPWRRHVVAVLVNCLFWQPVVVFAGGVRVDPNGGNTRLDTAGNGVPVVDIATPNAKGLSHNTFRDYNVDARGLILNNATDKLQSTQLGGLIVGNPNLHEQAAKLIINEVNGGRSSRLAGYTEVAGRQANVVVANPYGITCDGCGFINSPRVTLSTGQPVIADGELDHFAVEQGQIAIEGLGLDATQVDQFDILTRAATLNAEIHARRLNLVTGANDVDADSLAATPRAGRGTVPALAIDSSALGGMYADRISLVGTEAGVGVKLAGDMATSAGDLRIDVDGHLHLADASSHRRVAIDADGATFNGDVHATDRIDLNVRGGMANRGVLVSGTDVTLDAGGDIVNRGTLSAGVAEDGQRQAGRLSVSARRLDNRGQIDATTRIEANLDILDNTGDLLADELALTTHEALTNAGTMHGRNVSVDAGNQLANTGSLQGDRLTVSAATLANQGAGAVMAANDTLRLDAGVIANHGGTLLFGSGQDAWLDAQMLDNDGGTLRVDEGSLRGHVAALSNRDGTLAADTLTLDVGALVNDAGLLSGDRALALAVGDELSNRGGQLQVTQGDLQLSAGSLDNSGGVLLGENLVLTIDDALVNRAGQLLGETLTLDAASLDNGDAGLIAAGTGGLDATLVGALGNAGGQIQAEGNIALSAGPLDNQHGTILGESLTLRAAHLDNGDGEISGSELTVAGASLANEGGSLIARQGALHVAMTGELDNRAGQLAGETLTLDAGALVNDAGLLSADRALALAVGDELSNRGGQVQVTQGDLQLSAGSLDNAGGVLMADSLSLALDGALTNRGGQLAGETLTLDAASLDNGGDGLVAADDLLITLGDALRNDGGRLQGQDAVTLDAATIDNRRGQISGGRFSLTAAVLDNDSGLLDANGAMMLAVGEALSNRGGHIQAVGGDLNLTTGTLDNAGGVILGERLVLDVAGAIDNRDGQLVGSAIDLDAARLDNGEGGAIVADAADLTMAQDDTLNNAGGRLQAKNDVTLAAETIDDRGGVISARAVSLEGATLDNRGGQLVASQGALKLSLAGTLDNDAGQLVGKTVSLDAGTVTNDGGLFSADGGLVLVTDQALSNRNGQMQTAHGNLRLDAGMLDNTQGVLLADRLDLQVDGAIANRGGRLAGDALTLGAASLDNGDDGLIAVGAGGLSATLVDTLSNAGGRLQADGDIALTAERLDNRDGAILGDGLTLRAARLDNRGGVLLGEAGGLVTTLSATSGTALDNRDGLIDIQAGGLQLTATGGALNNRGGTLSAERLSIDAKSLDNGDDGQVLAGTGGLILDIAAIANQGGLLSAVGGALTATFTALDNRGGTLQGDAVSATGATLDNRDDGLIAALAGDISLWLDQRLDNRQGRILAQQALIIDPPTIDNRQGQLAGQQVSLEAGTLANDSGLIEATDALRIDADTLDNVDGDLRVLGGDNAMLHVAGTLNNGHGRIALASHDATLEAATLRNADGSLTHAGNGRLTLDLDTWQGNRGKVRGTGAATATLERLDGLGDWQFNQGLELSLNQALALGANDRLASPGALTLHLPGLDNRGTIAANLALTIDSDGDITNHGLISAQGNLDVRGRNLTQHDGRLASGGDATYRLSGALDNLGRLTAVGDLDLDAGAITNRGTLGSQNDLRLVSGGRIDNLADTLLFAGGDMTLRGGRLFNRYADIYSRGNLDFARNDQGKAATRLENRSGTIEAEGDIDLTVVDLLNTKDEYAVSRRAVGRSTDIQRQLVKGYDTLGGTHQCDAQTCKRRNEHRDYYKYLVMLSEETQTTVEKDSPSAVIAAGGGLSILADGSVANENSRLLANDDLRISARSVKNQGDDPVTENRERVYGFSLSRYTFTRVNEAKNGWNTEYSINPKIGEFSEQVRQWNGMASAGGTGSSLELPDQLAEFSLQSDVTKEAPVAGGANAVISAGGKVSIHASERIDNGELREHQRSQLTGRMGSADTAGPLNRLTVTLNRQSQAATPQEARDVSGVPRGEPHGAGLLDTMRPGGVSNLGQRIAVDSNNPARAFASVAGAPTAVAAASLATLSGVDYRRVVPAQSSDYRLPEGQYGLFVRATSPKSHYLVETNPEFTTLDGVRGSDYLLDKLDYTADGTYRMLGDGRYESRMIRDAVLAETGQRFLKDGLTNDEAQYRYLMDNAAAAQRSLDLEVGVRLTPEQTAALDRDIVWLERQMVDGQEVLAPVLYLAQVDERNVRGNSLIQGRDIELIAGGDLVNVGTIRASRDLAAQSGGSVLQGGLIESGERLDVSATEDIRNALAGEIRGGRVSLEAIRGDLVNDRTAATAGYERDYRTYLDVGSAIDARESLAVTAGRDIVNRAAIVSAGNVALTAGRDIDNRAVEAVHGHETAFSSGVMDERIVQHGARLVAGGDARVNAGRDVTISASELMAAGDLTVTAGNGIALDAAANSTRRHNGRGTVDEKTIEQVGSRVTSGGGASFTAGGNIALAASTVDSRGGLDMTAGNDIVLNAAEEGSYSRNRWWGHASRSQHTEQVGSNVSAVGDVSLVAGRDVTATASQVTGDDIVLQAGRDVELTSAQAISNDESYTRYEKRVERHVRQQGSSLDASGDLSVSAGNDINLVASQARADDTAYLFAGRHVNLLAATDQDYSLYEKEKDGGLFGSSSYRRDEVDDRRAVGSQIVGGDGLSVFSGGDQSYQGARLESGGDLTLTSLGSIDFATASDLHSESHEKSSGNFAWQSSKGEGRTDETLRQSELIARGETLIRAANGLNIDVSQIDQQTVSQTIDAMVAADPDLAWLKDMEARGDVDWHQVKAIHDNWDYSQSGLGAGAALAISIAAVAIVGPAAAGAAGFTSGTASFAAFSAATASLTTTGTVSLINNRGDLGDAFDDTLSSESLKGALIAAASAGAAQGLDSVWGGSTDIANGQTTGFDLSDWSGTGRFVGQRASQAVVDAGLQTAIAGGEFDEHLRQTLQGAASTVLEATLFNQVGELGARYPELLADGEGGKIALHALAGGLAAEATGGDFRTGAAAAGANEALIKQLNTLVDRDPQLLVAASKLTGLMAAGLVDGDVAQGAEIAGNATTYNYLSHWQEAKKDEELAGCKDKTTCKIGTTVKWAMVDAQQEAGLLIGSAGGIALSAKESAEGVYALVTNFPEVMDGLKQLATSPEFRQQFGENYLNDLQVRADRLNTAYETAGWDGSITAGVEGGRFAAELVGVLTAVKGGAQLIAKLPASAGKLIEAARPSPGSDSLGSLGSQATKGRAIAEYGPLHKGPLPDGIANTFRSGTYREVVTTEPTTLYRVMGDKGKTAGGYWTQTKPAGPLQSIIDSALDQNWGNTATRVVEMDVPVGTRIFEGVAAPQRGLVGGGNQVYFDRAINPLDPSWIKQ